MSKQIQILSMHKYTDELPIGTIVYTGGGSSSGGGGGTGGSTALSGLTDVFLSSPQDADILTFSGSTWRNKNYIRTQKIYGSSGTTLYLNPDPWVGGTNKVYVGDAAFTSIGPPDRALNVFGGIYSQGNLEFPPNRSIYMGATSDTGPRFNWKQISTVGVDQGVYMDFYPKMVWRSDNDASRNKMILWSSGQLDILNNLVVSGNTYAKTNLYVDGASTFTGTQLLSGNTTLVRNFTSPTYFSGFAGSGFQLSQIPNGDNMLTVDNLTVRKSMNVYELIINKIRCTNGSLWVSDSCKISAVTYSAPTYHCIIDSVSGDLIVPFVQNDLIRCQHWSKIYNSIKYYTARVTNVDVAGTWFECQVVDGAGTPANGDDTVRIGNTTNIGRQGSLYLTSNDVGNPFMDIMDGVSTSSFTNCTKVRIGNLVGITDTDFGGSLSGYGLYCQNIFAKGKIVISAGSSGYSALTDKPTTLAGINSTESSKLTGIQAGATVGADWNSNVSNKPTIPTNTNQLTDGANLGGTAAWGSISSKPGYIGAPTGTGLYMDGTKMGFYDGGWKVYIQNDGDFVLGDTSLTTPGLFWDQSAGTLNIKGAISITNTIPAGSVSGLATVATSGSYSNISGGPPTNADHTASNTAAGISGQGSLATMNSVDYTSGYVTNKPTIPTNTNQLTDGANLGGTAIWTGISSKPTGAASLITTPAGAGLWIDGTHMGYYDGNQWSAVISSDGSATFKGVVEFGTAATTGPWSSAQNLAMIGSDIYEGMCHTSDAAIHINRLGYHGVQGVMNVVDGYYNYPRATYIHQNTDSAMVQFESGGITFNKNVGITNVATFGNGNDATNRTTTVYGQFVHGNVTTVYGNNSFTMDKTTGSYVRMLSNQYVSQAVYIPGAAAGDSIDVGTTCYFTNSNASYNLTIVCKRGASDTGYGHFYINNGSIIDQGGSEHYSQLDLPPKHSCIFIYDGIYWHLISYR